MTDLLRDMITREIELLEAQEPCACCDNGFVRDGMHWCKDLEVYYCSECAERLDAEAMARLYEEEPYYAESLSKCFEPDEEGNLFRRW